MSRSQGAANSGWPPQRYPAAEPDPRTGGHPAQRPQAVQQAPQYAPQQAPAPSYPPQQGYPQQAYADPRQQQPAYAPQSHQPQAHQPQPRQPQAHPQQQPAYHYPAQQTAPQPQYAPQQHIPQSAVPRTAPPTQPSRQALSSLDSARNAQPTHEIEGFPRTQPPQYARAQQQAHAPAQRAQYAPPQAAPQAAENPINAALGYRQPAQQAAPQYAAPRAPAQAPAQGYDAWPAQHAELDPYAQPAPDYFQADAGYAANGNQSPFDTLQQADWSLSGAGYDDPLNDQQGYGHAQHGYDQTHGGALETTYNQDDAGYEVEEPRRASWTMRIAGAVVVAIGLGYGLAQAYKSLVGPSPDGAPPVIASDASPAKEKPVDPGGRQFSHTDSKVLGRLGEAESQTGGLSLTDTDDSSANGTRQVKTLVVGRDGSIAPPSAPAEQDAPVSVPGLTVVDAFGNDSHPPPQHVAATEPVRQPDPEPVASPPPRSGVNVKTTRVIPSSTASLRDEAPAAAPPRKQKVASTGTSGSAATGANGYVVVLASVPASSTSRLDALRKFADMQQQYGPVLGNKTPDVRETTLAGKGPYHRLLVGPPGSRTQANELCTQLKAYGYKDCWVTAY